MVINQPSSEAILIEAAQRGEANAFQILVTTHQSSVLGFLYRLGNETEIAQDLAQETFIKAWMSIKNYQHQQKFRSWLLKIAYNTTVDSWRKQRPTTPLDDVIVEDGYPTPENLVAQQEHTEMVKRAIQSLPQQSRTALILREYHQLSYQEIADTLEIPLGTVMSRLNYARKILRNALQPLMEERYA